MLHIVVAKKKDQIRIRYEYRTYYSRKSKRAQTVRARPPFAVPFLLLVLATAAPAGALRFDLLSGHTKCISDDIKVGAMAVGKYHVMAPDDGASSWSSSSPSQQQQLPDSHRISLRVTASYGNSLHYAENVHSGNFAFTASEASEAG